MDQSNTLYTNVEGPRSGYVSVQKVYRVIDDGIRVVTTSNPAKALEYLQELIEKHNVTWCWVDIEELEKEESND